MRKNLMARTVAALKPGAQQYDVWDTNLRGFGVRVAPSGHKAYAIRYTLNRKLRRMRIGDAAKLSLADARETARTALREVELGRDPALQRAERREAKMVPELADDYLERHAKPKKRSWREDRRLIESEIKPAWKHRVANDIRNTDVIALLNAIVDRGAPVLANRVRALLSVMFAHGKGQGMVDANPVRDVKPPSTEHGRERVLNHDELRRFCTACNALPVRPRAAWMLRLLTAQRGNEVVRMKWTDVDLVGGWWTIPADDAKNGRLHRVPLNDQALTLLKAVRADVDAERAAREARTNKPAPEPAFVLAGVRGTRQRREAAKDFGIENFVPHDLRRTAATYMAGAGVDFFHVAHVLNHSSTTHGSITATYARYTYDREKKAALDTWDRVLRAIIDNEGAKDGTTNNVVQFPRG